MENPIAISSTTSRKVPDKFLVAFSLAGEQRELVRAIAEAVEKKIGFGKVFLDEWFEFYIAGDDADIWLQEIYGEKCELAVVCVSERYGGKPWTRAEHRAIRARQMKADGSKVRLERLAVLPIRVGEGDVDGILFNAIVPDVRDRSAEKSAELIIERLRLIAPDLIPGSDPSAVELSWPESPDPLHWPVADHGDVREAFAQLLARKRSPAVPADRRPLRDGQEPHHQADARQCPHGFRIWPADALTSRGRRGWTPKFAPSCRNSV